MSCRQTDKHTERGENITSFTLGGAGKKVQKLINFTTDLSAYFQLSTKSRNPSWQVGGNSYISQKTSSQITNMVSDHVTQPWMWYDYSSNNESRLSMSDMTSGSALWTYNVLLIQSGMQSYSSNSLPLASKVNSRSGFNMLLPLLLQPTCGTQQNPFISSPCQGWSYTRQWSGPSVIPELHKWSLWRFGKSTLSNC